MVRFSLKTFFNFFGGNSKNFDFILCVAYCNCWQWNWWESTYASKDFSMTSFAHCTVEISKKFFILKTFYLYKLRVKEINLISNMMNFSKISTVDWGHVCGPGDQITSQCTCVKMFVILLFSSILSITFSQQISGYGPVDVAELNPLTLSWNQVRQPFCWKVWTIFGELL